MSRTRASLASLLVGALALGLATLLPVEPATAFKPYTHVVVGHMAMTDAVDDGRVTIGGRSYAVRPKIVEALRAWPSYFRAGTVGPDGFPDLTYGQSVIHPDRTGEWLRYLLREAWAAQSDTSYSAAEKGQILAFTYGFLSHAASDVWAHTLINDFAQGVFPDAPEILTSVPKAAIALRHIIVEGYVGDATVGFDGNPERTTLGSGDVSDDSTPGLSMDAPTRWIYRTLVDPRVSLPSAQCRNGQDEDKDGVADDGCFGAGPYRRGDAEQSRGPLIDHFLDLQSDLQLRRAVLKADMNHANCWIRDPDCYKQSRTVRVDTVRGTRQATITVQSCIGAYIGCIPSGSDLAHDKLLGKAWMAYLNNWVDDIESGLRAWGQLGLATTRGLFDPQARRNLQNEECGEYPEGIERGNCEDDIGIVDVVMHQARPFITGHLLSMLGAPDATGKVLDALKALSELIDSLLPYNPLKVGIAALEKKAKDLILAELRRVVGIDLATLDHMLKNPSVWMEIEQIQLDLGPKLGSRTVNLFPPGTRDRLDAILGLTPQDRVTTTVPMPNGSSRTVGVLSDSAVMRNAAPYDNAITLGKLLLLDANGLNQVITDSLVTQGVMKEGAYARVYRDGGSTPANVMVDGLNGGDPWLKLIDGDHVWRQNGKPRFTSGEGHGGTGNFPLWESCLVRPAFGGTLFRDWENGGLAFPALGDPTSEGDWADTTAPAGGINVLAPSYLRKGGKKMSEQMRFLGVGMLEFTASDTIFSDIAVKQQVVVKRLTSQSSQFFTNYGQLSLEDTEGEDDGYRSITQSVGDPCNALVKRKTLTFTLDTLGPEVTILSPEEGLVVDSAERFPILWTIADQGPPKWVSGVDEEQTVAVIQDRPAPQSGEFRAFGLYPGTQALEVTGSDRVENTGGGYRFFEVQATSDSLVKNVAQGAASQAFPSTEMRDLLEGILTEAANAHTAGDHVAEGDSLRTARQMLNDQRGLGVAEWYADYMIAHIDDLLSRHVPPPG
jgi:hypothetical protein